MEDFSRLLLLRFLIGVTPFLHESNYAHYAQDIPMSEFTEGNYQGFEYLSGLQRSAEEALENIQSDPEYEIDYYNPRDQNFPEEENPEVEPLAPHDYAEAQKIRRFPATHRPSDNPLAQDRPDNPELYYHRYNPTEQEPEEPELQNFHLGLLGHEMFDHPEVGLSHLHLLEHERGLNPTTEEPRDDPPVEVLRGNQEAQQSEDDPLVTVKDHRDNPVVEDSRGNQETKYNPEAQWPEFDPFVTMKELRDNPVVEYNPETQQPDYDPFGSVKEPRDNPVVEDTRGKQENKYNSETERPEYYPLPTVSANQWEVQKPGFTEESEYQPVSSSGKRPAQSDHRRPKNADAVYNGGEYNPMEESNLYNPWDADQDYLARDANVNRMPWHEGYPFFPFMNAPNKQTTKAPTFQQKDVRKELPIRTKIARQLRAKARNQKKYHQHKGNRDFPKVLPNRTEEKIQETNEVPVAQYGTTKIPQLKNFAMINQPIPVNQKPKSNSSPFEKDVNRSSSVQPDANTSSVQPEENIPSTTQPDAHPDANTSVQQYANASSEVQPDAEPDANASSVVRPDVNTSSLVQPEENISSTAQPDAKTAHSDAHILSVEQYANASSVVQPDANISSTTQPDANISASVQPDANTLSEYANASSVVQPDANISSTAQPDAKISASVQPDANISEYANASSVVQPDANISSTAQPYANISSSVQPNANKQSVQPDESISSTVEPDANISSTAQPDRNTSSSILTNAKISSSVQPHVNTSQSAQSYANKLTAHPDLNTSSTAQPDVNILATAQDANALSTAEPDANTSPSIQPNANTSLSVQPYANISSTAQPDANISISSSVQPDANTSSVLQPDTNISSSVQSDANTLSVGLDESISSKAEPDGNTSPSVQGYAKTSSVKGYAKTSSVQGNAKTSSVQGNAKTSSVQPEANTHVNTPSVQYDANKSSATTSEQDKKIFPNQTDSENTTFKTEPKVIGKCEDDIKLNSSWRAKEVKYASFQSRVMKELRLIAKKHNCTIMWYDMDGTHAQSHVKELGKEYLKYKIEAFSGRTHYGRPTQCKRNRTVIGGGFTICNPDAKVIKSFKPPVQLIEHNSEISWTLEKGLKIKEGRRVSFDAVLPKDVAADSSLKTINAPAEKKGSTAKTSFTIKDNYNIEQEFMIEPLTMLALEYKSTREEVELPFATELILEGYVLAMFNKKINGKNLQFYPVTKFANDVFKQKNNSLIFNATGVFRGARGITTEMYYNEYPYKSNSSCKFILPVKQQVHKALSLIF